MSVRLSNAVNALRAAERAALVDELERTGVFTPPAKPKRAPKKKRRG